MTTFSQANNHLRSGNPAQAIPLYLQALRATPDLSRVITPSIILARKRHLTARQGQKPSIAVCGWELAHNPAGRAYNLAQMYATFAHTEIIGAYFPKWGRKIWPPLGNVEIPVHSFVAEDQTRFVDQALELVTAHPYDVVHLSKPRMPNILFGLLYKLIWGATVLMDIDDEELAFADAETPLALDAYLQKHGRLPELTSLEGKEWTRLGVGLATAFDGVTVSNPALQKRYGGQIIRHARDEKRFQPSPELSSQSRKKFKVLPDKKVVLFFGTPREHKGLVETARAIAGLGRKDVVFAIVGDFPDPALKQKLEAVKDVDYLFLGNQPVQSIPEVTALGDVCVLLQEPGAMVSNFQIPAKLTDVLAMGRTVILQDLPPTADVIQSGAVIPVKDKNALPRALEQALAQPPSAQPGTKARDLFLKEFSFAANTPRLRKSLEEAQTQALKIKAVSKNNTLSTALRPLLKNIDPLTPYSFLANLSTKIQTDNPDINQWSESAASLKLEFQSHGDSLPAKALVQISSQLFALDDFIFSAKVLQKAKEKYPDDDQVLKIEKNQYYYYAYSSWLMKTMAGDAEWYKADGLSERPDWNTAVALCKRFVSPKAENPPGELRQFVQAGLLLAEECRDKNDHQRADEVVRDTMRHLGAGWVEEYSLPVVQAIRRVRTEGGEALDAETEKIQKLLAGIPVDVLSVQGWLSLNDILNWNGLLRCGLVARDHALAQARKQGDAHPKQANRQLVAARAALDQGDFAAAKNYIARYRASSGNARTADEMSAYCCLLQGDVEGFRRHFGYPVTEADRRFQEYIRGKSVAIVGPAPSDEAHGKEIDSFDVVIRFNYRGLGAQPDPEKYGTKTHVSLYNAHGFRHLVATKAFNLLEELDFCLIRRPRSDLETLPVDKSRIRQIHEPNQAFYKSMNAVPAMVYDLLLQGAGKIKIFNSNFYLSKQHHSEQYRYLDEDLLDGMPLRKLQPVLANHDLLAQIFLMASLQKTNRLSVDDNAKMVLALKNERYLYYLDKLCAVRQAVSQSSKAQIICKKTKAYERENEYIKNFRKNCPLAQKTHRPLLIVGGGPSNAYFDPRRVPSDPVVFRVNMFMLEPDYRFGNHVDAVFWAIHRRILHVSLETAINHGFYTVDYFFRPNNLMDRTLSFFRDDTSRHVQLFRPTLWHWELFKKYPEFDPFFFNRKHGGLPTVGLQALAVGLILGFRDIYLSGFDFYKTLSQSAKIDINSRYYYQIPDYLKVLFAKDHLQPGYETKSHSEQIDILFLEMLTKVFSNAEISCAVPESPLSNHKNVPSYFDQCFNPSGFNADKNTEMFHDYNKDKINNHQNQMGEIEYKDGTLSGWAWDATLQDKNPAIQFIGDDKKILAEFSPKSYRHDLDMNNIGHANFGFVSHIHKRKDLNNNKHIRVCFKNGSDLCGSPIKVNSDYSSVFLKHPERKECDIEGIKLITENHFWYKNIESNKNNKYSEYFRYFIKDKFPKKILIVTHDLYLSTGVVRSLSHYLNFMRNCKNVCFTCIEPENGVDLKIIEYFFDDFDFIIFNSISMLMNFNGLVEILNKLDKNKFALYFHETEWGFGIFKEQQPKVYDLFLKNAAQYNYFCVSEKQANLFRNLLFAKNIYVVYETTSLSDGSHIENSSAAKVTNNCIKIVMSGTLQPRKGVTLFSEVADMAHKEGLPWKFQWAGHAWKKHIDSIYMSPQVQFVGRLEGDKYRDFLHQSDVFFLSSADDPFPLSSLEAIQLKKRLICYCETGISEVLNGVHGTAIYYDYSPESAFNALKNAIQSDVDREMYAVLNNKFSIISFAKKLNRSISEVYNNSKQLNNYIIVSHHPKEFDKGVCNSIYQIFVKPHCIIFPNYFLNLNTDTETFTSNLYDNLTDKTVLVFNGVFSLMFQNSLLALNIAIERNIEIIIYWHETAWNLRLILGKNSEARRIQVNNLVKLFSTLKITNWVTSTQCMHAVATLFGFPFESFKVVHEIVDLSRFQVRHSTNYKKNEINFAGAGIPDLRKGVDRFDYIAKHLNSKLNNYSTLSFSWYFSSKEQQVLKGIPETKYIKWKGFSDNFEKSLHEIDIFLLTSRDDPFPLVALEALATGCPVFVFNSTGYGEVLPDFLIARDPDEMIAKLLDYLNAPPKPPSFFRNIAENFSQEKFIKRAFPEIKFNNFVPLPKFELYL